MAIDFDNLVAWRLMGQQQQQMDIKRKQEREDADTLLKQSQANEAQKNAEFNRQMEVAKFQANAAKELGQQVPQYENPHAQQMADMGSTQADLSGLNRQRTADIETLKSQRDFDKVKYIQDQENSRSDTARAYDLDKSLQEMANQHDIARMNLDAKKKEPDPLAMMRLQLMMSRLADQETSKQDTRMQKLERTTKDVPDLNDLKIVAHAVQQPDIPGQGPWDALKLAVGAGSDEDVQAAEATQRLHNAYLHMVSGGAVTPSEADRAAIATGLGQWTFDPKKRREGVKALLRNIQQAMLNMQSAAHPEDVSLRHERGGVTAADIPQIADDMPQAPVMSAPKKNPFE